MSVEYRSDSRVDTVPVTVHAAALDEITRLRAENDKLREGLEKILQEPNETMSDGKALREIIRITRYALGKKA